jgi:TolA-binding protein
LRSFSDLLTATVVGLGVTSPYTDQVTVNVPYYYALVFEEDIREGKGTLYPGSNATVVPAEVSTRQTAGNQMENQTSYQNQFALPPQNGYRSETDSPFSTMREQNNSGSPSYNQGSTQGYRAYQNNEEIVMREPRVFNKDMQNSASNEDDYQLALIVQGPFMWRNWQAARSSLMQFMAVTRGDAPFFRAHFYLGQCYYFLGDIRSALTEFLGLQQQYPDEVAAWIQACLTKMSGR